MSTSLSDLEALALTCRAEESKDYITESLLCYKSGAFRASIVTCWIAVVFDLIDKIRELSISGDPIAKDLETRYETYMSQIEEGNPQGIKSALEFERSLLETCRNKLQFFDTHQYLDLERLLNDRHRCAHPSFQRVGIPYQPSAEQARLHLRNAITHVLSQPPVQGKAAIAELKATVSSAYFPSRTEAAVQQLKQSSLKKATGTLVRNFIDALIFGFISPSDPLYRKQQALSAVRAIEEMYPEETETRLRKNLNNIFQKIPDKDFVLFTVIAVRCNSGWLVLNDTAKEKTRQFVSSGPINEILPGLQYFIELPEMREIAEQRISGLSLEELEQGISQHNLGVHSKECVLKLLSQVRSWDQANRIFNGLAIPLIDVFSAADVERIIRMPSENGADIAGAFSYGEFIKMIRGKGLFEAENLDELLRNNGASYLCVDPDQVEPTAPF